MPGEEQAASCTYKKGLPLRCGFARRIMNSRLELL